MLFFLSLARAEDIYVTSNAREAAIFVNGVDTGYRTPATVPGVKPGETLISVEGSCMRGEAVVNVAKGLTTRVSIVATDQLGTLSLVPSPVAARLELDSAPYQGVPGVPLAVKCGDHTVRASLEGYITAVVTVEVGMGQDLTVPLNLPKLGLGSVDLSVTPRAGTLLVDGRPVGSDAVSLPSVYQGVHVISAELDGYQPLKKQIVVDDASTQAWHFDLVRTGSKRVGAVSRIGGEGESEEEEAQREAQREAERAAAADRERVSAREREEAARVRAEAEVRAAREARDAEARDAEAREAEAREAEAREAEAREAEARDAEVREAEARDAEAREAEALAAREARERKAAAARRAEEEAENAEREAAERDAEEAAAADAERRRRDAQRVAREPAPREADQEADRAPIPPAKAAKAIAGVGMLAGGVGASVFGVVAYDQTARAYNGYTAKIDGANSKNDVRAADAYYDEYVVPRQTVLYGTAIGAGLLLAGGVVVLVIDEHLPTPVPTPGGGMLLWTGKF